MEGELIPYKMLSQDAYSQSLGIKILECEIGRCKLGMTIRKEMLNIMNKAITYALADTAFGFTANTHGKYAVSIVEVKRGNELIALFKGVVYRTEKDWKK